MKKVLLWLMFAGFLSLPVMAQDHPKVEVFGGYQFQSVGGDLGWQLGSPYNGWDTSATFYFSERLGVTVDLSGNYHSGTFGGGPYSTHIYTFAVGPVFSLGSRGKFKPSVHALVGGARITTPTMYGSNPVYATETGYTAMLGAGVDYKWKRSIAVRLAQVDWIYYYDATMGDLIYAGSGGRRSDSPNFFGNVRISAGIVFRYKDR